MKTISDKDYTLKVCEMSLKYSVNVPSKEREEVNCSSMIAALFYKVFDKDTIALTETSYAMILDNSLHLLGIINIGMGDSVTSMLDQRKTFQAALLCNGTRLVICHNHPSGALRPSVQDRQSTLRMKESGKIIGIELIDHIILSPDGEYLSFADEGMI